MDNMIFRSLIDVIKDKVGIKGDGAAGKKIGLSDARVSQLKKTPPPNEKSWAKLLGKFWDAAYSEGSKLRINPLAELYPIEPNKSGSTWRIQSKGSELKDRIKGKMGIYLFYDSRGSVTYVGQTKGCLFFEVKQALSRDLRGLHFSQDLVRASKKTTPLQQGNVIRAISVYELFDSTTIHNIEALFLRSLANDLLNSKLGKFKS